MGTRLQAYLTLEADRTLFELWTANAIHKWV